MSALWFFIKQLKQYRTELFLGLALGLILAAASIALMSLSGWFISAAAFAGLATISASHFNYFIPAGFIRLLALLRILSRYGERVINHDFTFKILTQLRVWLYQSILPLSPTHFSRYRSGELLGNMIHDIDVLDHLYLRILSPCIVALLVTIGVYIFIHFFSNSLAITTLIFLGFSLICVPLICYYFGKKIGVLSSEAISELRIQTIDFIQGLLPILFYIKPENRLNKVKDANNAFSIAQKKLAHLKGFTVSTITLLSGITLILTLYLGIPLVNKHSISGAQLAMIMLCIIIAFEQIMSLPLSFLAIGKTQESAKRLLSIAQQQPAIQFPQQSSATIDFSCADVAFHNICFQYPTRTTPVFKNISLKIPSGTTTIITGPSGSGKTTLMHLLTRIWEPTSGEIIINNLPLPHYTESELRTMIVTVPQHVHIFNASIRDNLTLMQRNIADEKLYEILDIVDLKQTVKALPNMLNTQMGDYGKQFSGGQIRRIGLARALLSNAPIHIWDEPSTGLNKSLFEKIWSQARLLLHNKTLIIITHETKLIPQADQQVSLEKCKD